MYETSRNDYGQRKYIGTTILIVDDQPEIAKMLRVRFEKEGAQVYVGINGDEGLRYATTYKPDLILLDIMMPGTDGISMYRQLQQDRVTRTIPVVFLTAAPNLILERDDLDFPDELVFAKPFSSSNMFSAIDEILKRHI